MAGLRDFGRHESWGPGRRGATWLCVALLVLMVTGGIPTSVTRADRDSVPGDAPLACRAALYRPERSLAATLLATRRSYRQWTASQPAARQTVRLEPWLGTPPLPAGEVDPRVAPDRALDRDARLADNRPLWSPRPDLADGKVVALGGGPEGQVVWLARPIRAGRGTQLTIGLGAGNRIDLWLNGRRLCEAATRLTSGRYGCAERVDGTRVDQVLVDLDLRQGENWLLARVVSGSEPSFWFSTAPRPIPRLWERIRQDFPARVNPLLELVSADWFTETGWFSARDVAPERQLLERLAPDCGVAESVIHDRRAELEQDRRDDNADDREAAWLDLCVAVSWRARLERDTERVRLAVEELGRRSGAAYPAAELLAVLADYYRRVADTPVEKLATDPETTRRWWDELQRLQREMLVDLNPLLRGAEILFVKRHTYDSKHYYDDFQHIRQWGGNLCGLDLASGQVRHILPQMTAGVYDRYDLSFDARCIVFGYRRPQREGFRIWQVDVDGRNLHQITQPPDDESQRMATYGQTSTGDGFYGSLGYGFWTDDVHPCWLPDGGICFASTRCEHGVLCTPAHYLACTNLFRIQPDGTHLRPISQGALSEFTPTLMDDGRILYTRWEYVYKGIAAVQSLWMMRPDGSGSEEFFGDNIANPGVFWQARPLPGDPQRVVCTGCGHEPLGVGQLLVVDIGRGKRSVDAMTSLTPNVKTQGLRGLYQLRNGLWREDIYGPFYADPYPLSDSFFLVSCNPDRRYNDPAAYSLYLLDRFGNRVLIYDDPDISCWQPMVVRPRRRPPVIVATQLADRNAGASSEPGDTATVFISDVYQGLTGVERGVVKYVRVVEQVPKPWAAEVDLLRGEDRSADGFGGHLAISWNGHIWVAVLHGIVPVAEDGSACFEVPARRNLFFQALDEDFMEVQRMRTFVNFEPGEQRSCIGCHEQRSQAPAPRQTAALRRPPLRLVAQPGEIAPRPLYYPSDVQPILDRQCLACHGGQEKSAPPDLRGDLTTIFSRSYENLLQGGLVATIREWNGLEYSMENAEAVGPYSLGSHRSRLVALLRADHYDVRLSREEWIKLVTWIDCGAPYYGSYFGRRNLGYRGQPDFRPEPTLASACGTAPPQPALREVDGLPAELLVHWKLDAAAGPTIPDATAQGHDAVIEGGRWLDRAGGSQVLAWDGNGYLAASGLGQHASVSVSLWVHPQRLPNRWNPLLFSDGSARGAFHFSLLADGTPNVAINTAPNQWTHRHGQTPLPLGEWHHLVVTCDPRVPGVIRYYVDGRKDSEQWLGLGTPLDLESFRVGAYRSWAGTPGGGFHGMLRDVRVFQGTLTPTEVRQLFAAGNPCEPRASGIAP